MTWDDESSNLLFPRLSPGPLFAFCPPFIAICCILYLSSSSAGQHELRLCTITILFCCRTMDTKPGLWPLAILVALSECVWVRYGVSFETDEDDECKVWIIGAGRATQPPAAVMGSVTVSFWMFFPLWIYCDRLTCGMNKTKHLFSKYRFSWSP